jgi:hypothetical protein
MTTPSTPAELAQHLDRIEALGRECLQLLDQETDLAVIEGILTERQVLIDGLSRYQAALTALANGPTDAPVRVAFDAVQAGTAALAARAEQEVEQLRSDLRDQNAADNARRVYGMAMPTPISIPRVVG